MSRSYLGWLAAGTIVDVLVIALIGWQLSGRVAEENTLCRNLETTTMNVYVVGTGTEDIFVNAGISPGPGAAPGKIVCEVTSGFGGGGLNVARSALAHGAKVELLLMVGLDPLGDHVRTELGEEFVAVRCLPVLKSTRRSVLFNTGKIYTNKAETVLPVWDPALEESVRSAQVVVVAPFPVEENPFVSQLLNSAQQSVWMPSGEQLRNLDSFVDLANQTKGFVIFNQAEGESATGEAHPEQIINSLRGRGVKAGLVVTSETGALAWTTLGDFCFAPAVVGGEIIQIAKAGDQGVGAFVTARFTEQRSLPESLVAMQLASGRHVRGLEPLRSIADLLAWGSTQPMFDPVAEHRAQQQRTSLAAGAALAAMAVAMTAIWLLLPL